MSRWRTRHRGSSAERGAAAVEFAIVLVVLLLILLGIVDFGRLLFVSQSIKSASREAARTAVVAGNYETAATEAASAAAGLSANSGSLTCNYQISDAAGAFSPANEAAVDWSTQAACDDTVPPCADAANPEAVRIHTEVTFSWLTPVGSLPGLVIPALQNDRPVGSTTTMRCE